jgi:glucose-1-phosphate cytidylyltransferase
MSNPSVMPKAVILAGGLGTRLSEETVLRPKPMVEIGGKPLLWHVMKIYAAHGVTDFVICCGFKGYVIKEYFANYFLHMSDVTFDMAKNSMEVHQRNAEPWKVTLVDTGEKTQTGGRLGRVREHLNSTFFLTYGDGVGDVDIAATLAFHRKEARQATVTAVQPPGRYGALHLSGTRVEGFTEKPRGDGGLINGGFFVLSPRCIDLIEGESTAPSLSLESGDESALAFRRCRSISGRGIYLVRRDSRKRRFPTPKGVIWARK